jgi:hypothetical protein
VARAARARRSVAVAVAGVAGIAALTGCLGDDPPARASTAAATTVVPTTTASTAAATSTTAVRLGSAQRPIEPGTPFAINADWTVVVRSASDEGSRTTTTTTRLNGTTTTDPFGTIAPPPPATVRVGIGVTYTGVYAQGHLTTLRLGVVGTTAVPYRAGPCPDSVRDPLALDAAVAKGDTVEGTVCFLVERADAAGLQLYVRAGTTTRDVYFALPSRR